MSQTTTSFDSIGAALQMRDYWLRDINPTTPFNPENPVTPGVTPVIPWSDPNSGNWTDTGNGALITDVNGIPIRQPRLFENPSPTTITTARQTILKTFKGASTNRVIFDENFTIQPANNSSWQRCMNGAGVYKNNWYLMIPNSNYAFVLFGPWEADANLKNKAYLIPAIKNALYYGGFQYLQTIPAEFITAFKSANATVPRNIYQEGIISPSSDFAAYQPRNYSDFTQTIQSVTYKFNFWGAVSKAVQPTILGIFSFVVQYYVGQNPMIADAPDVITQITNRIY